MSAKQTLKRGKPESKHHKDAPKQKATEQPADPYAGLLADVSLAPFGLDVGRSRLKLRGPKGLIDLDSQISATSDPNTIIDADVSDLDSVGGKRRKKKNKPILITFSDSHFNGVHYWVGSGAHFLSRNTVNSYNNYEYVTATPESRAFLYAGFTKYIDEYGEVGKQVALVVGVPLGVLKGKEDEIKGRKQEIAAWLSGTHVWCANGKPYAITIAPLDIEKHIKSQALGAVFDYVLDDQANIIADRKDVLKNGCMVGSIGSYTVEAHTIQRTVNGLETIPSMTDGCPVGTIALYNLLGESVSGMTPAMIDEGVRAKTIPVSEQASATWQRQVGEHLDRMWGQDWRRFKPLIFVGGGLMLPKVTQWLMARYNGRTYIPTDAIFSIVNGLYKESLRRLKQTQGQE
jgi:hypothetical protein